MIIHGKDIHMAMTVGASAAVGELCPDGELAKIGELFERPFAEQITVIAKVMAALVKGYEDKTYYETNGEHKRISFPVEEILSLSQEELLELEKEMFSAINNGAKTKVKTEAKKEEAELP